MKDFSSEFIGQLQEFFVHRFDDTELRWFVRCLTNEEIAATLPGPQESLMTLATAAVSTMVRHGYLENGDFFQRLYQARPIFRTTIDHLWRLWASTQKTPVPMNRSTPQQAQFHVTITASGDLSSLNYSALEKLVSLLKETTHDSSIVLEVVTRGSIVIGLRCSRRAHDQICLLFGSGSFPEIPELDIVDVDSVDSYLPPPALDLHDPAVALRICEILADNFALADLRDWLRRRHYSIYSSLVQSSKADCWSAYEIVNQFKILGIPAELIISSLLDECPSWIVSRLASPLQMSQRGKILLWRANRALIVLAMATLLTYLMFTSIAKQFPPPWSGVSGVAFSGLGVAACVLLFNTRTRRPAIVIMAITAVALGIIFWSAHTALSVGFWIGALPLSLLLWNRPTLQRLQTTSRFTSRDEQSETDFAQLSPDILPHVKAGLRNLDL